MARNLAFALTLGVATLLASGPAWSDITIALPSSSEGDALAAAAADYAKANDTTVKVVRASYNSLFERTSFAAANGSAAFDIILMDDPWIPFFAENGYLEELTPYFSAKDASGPDDDFLATSLALCRDPYNSGPYICLPYVGNAQLFFYDREKFNAVIWIIGSTQGG